MGETWVKHRTLGASQNLSEAFSALVQELLASNFFEAAEKESKQTRAEGAARDDEGKKKIIEAYEKDILKAIYQQILSNHMRDFDKLQDMAEQAQPR